MARDVSAGTARAVTATSVTVVNEVWVTVDTKLDVSVCDTVATVSVV